MAGKGHTIMGKHITRSVAILAALASWAVSQAPADNVTVATTATAPTTAPVSAAPKQIRVLTVQGVIGPMVANYLAQQIRTAERHSVECIIVQLDTPGGLLDSTHDITKAILGSDVPVVVYVSPEGARAASAGTFIVLASHVAAMSPTTHIGAAHPVGVQGEDIGEKIVNDSVAYIRVLAEQHGRNADWAEKAVRESVSLPASDALKEGVIDLIAGGLGDLTAKLDGMQVKVLGEVRVLHTHSVEYQFAKMSWVQSLFQILGHPNIAYILLMLGIWGLYFELANPGMVLPGVVGGLCLILGLLALSVLPINLAGVLLILLAVILFVAELMTPTSGVLTIGGIIAFVLGSFLMFDESPYGRVPWSMIITCSGMTALFMALVMHLVLKAHHGQVVSGVRRLIGESGQAQSLLDPDGVVLIHGEQWSARSQSGRIESGETIEVQAVEGLKLKVRKSQED